MSKRAKVFYVKRQVWSGGSVRDWLSIAGTAALLTTDPGGICMKYFLKAFGFTPRKGRVYKVTVGTFTVEEV